MQSEIGRTRDEQCRDRVSADTEINVLLQLPYVSCVTVDLNSEELEFIARKAERFQCRRQDIKQHDEQPYVSRV